MVCAVFKYPLEKTMHLPQLSLLDPPMRRPQFQPDLRTAGSGDAENAGLENAGQNLQGWKRQDKCICD